MSDIDNKISEGEIIEISSVVDYIKQRLIEPIQNSITESLILTTLNDGTITTIINTDESFTGNTYTNEVLGSDKDKISESMPTELDDYFNGNTIDSKIGDGKIGKDEYNRRGKLIKASEIVNALKDIVSDLTRLRLFAVTGKIKYRLFKKYNSNYRYEYDILEDDPNYAGRSISGKYTFLPISSDAYDSESIRKIIGQLSVIDPVANYKEISTDNTSQDYDVVAGQEINAEKFKQYIAALSTEWFNYVKNNTVQYYNETCYDNKYICHVCNCYKACDGRSRR